MKVWRYARKGTAKHQVNTANHQKMYGKAPECVRETTSILSILPALETPATGGVGTYVPAVSLMLFQFTTTRIKVFPNIGQPTQQCRIFTWLVGYDLADRK